MQYCPICRSALTPGKPCTCGWDASCDYENYLSLVPANDKCLSINARLRAYHQRLLDEQRSTYEAKIETLNQRQTAFEAELQAIRQACAADIQALTKRIAALEAQQSGRGPVSAPAAASDRQADSSIAGGPRQSPAHDDGAPVRDEDPYKNLKPGDVTLFGSYPQHFKDDDAKQPIPWLVLKREDNRALLISKNVLTAMPFSEKTKDAATWDVVSADGRMGNRTEATWETCTLKSWLNSSFLKSAFSKAEQGKILKSTTSEHGNSDQIFLLSIPEAEQYFTDKAALECKPTAYALAHGAYASDRTHNSCWWLRSSGYNQTVAAYADSRGSIYHNGTYITDTDVGVRPALWLDLTPASQHTEPNKQQAASSKPQGNAVSFAESGRQYYRQKQYDAAIQSYSTAIALDPQNTIYYNNRGNAYYGLNRYIEAITDYSDAIKLAPQDSIYYQNRGNAYYMLKCYDKAIPDYSDALRLNPRNAGLYNLRGNAYVALNRYDEAISDYSRAIDLDPGNSDYSKNKETALHKYVIQARINKQQQP